MKSLADNSVDSVVCDPPYELTAARPGGRTEATRGKVMGGFMGMAWDATGVAFDVSMWRETCRVLKPGGLLVAFGGTRTYHRLVCAIEDAGFEVRDMLAWLYGSGFPKGTDKAKIPEAWKGWNTALKPAIEPVCLARKPMIGTLAENLATWGTGAMWIDGCRIPLDGDEEITVTPTSKGALPTRHDVDEPRDGAPIESREPGLGRWPANVMHDGSDEVLDSFPDAPGQIADASSSSRKTQNVYGAMRRGNGREGEASADSANKGVVGFKMRPGQRRGDSGSAARFFYTAKASKHDRNDGLHGMQTRQHDPGRKAGDPGGDNPRNRGVHERLNNHPTVKPTELMRWLARLVTPPGGTLLDHFCGSGSTLKAADLEGLSAIGIDKDPDSVAIARNRISADAPLFRQVHE